MVKDSLKIQISLFIMLFVTTFLWLFDGIIGWKRITFIVVVAGFLILFTKKIQISRMSLVWILYLLAIAMSLLINHAITNWTVYMFLIYALIVLYAIFIRCDISVFKTVIVFLTTVGVLNAVMVMAHFCLKDRFNEAYFPLLQYQEALGNATFYYDRGYFFGVNYKPHETAGIIAFAMAAFLIWGFIQTDYRKKIIYLVPLLMFVPLLLTGKKGIILCVIGITMLLLVVTYISKKQWSKIFIAIGVAIALGIIAGLYILTHLDSPLFQRFAVLFTNLLSGQEIDSGRGRLRAAAWELWNEHRLFGVGWFQFNGYTVSRFNFSRSHSVNLDYLQFLCETGIPGFALMITPIIVMLRRTILVLIKILKMADHKKIQWIVLYAVFIQFFIVLYAFIEVPFYNIMYFSLYIFSCMIINNAYENNFESLRIPLLG